MATHFSPWILIPGPAGLPFEGADISKCVCMAGAKRDEMSAVQPSCTQAFLSIGGLYWHLTQSSKNASGFPTGLSGLSSPPFPKPPGPPLRTPGAHPREPPHLFPGLWPQDCWGSGWVLYTCSHRSEACLASASVLGTSGFSEAPVAHLRKGVASATVPLGYTPDSMNQEEMVCWEEASVHNSTKCALCLFQTKAADPSPQNCLSISHGHPITCPAGPWCYTPTPRKQKGTSVIWVLNCLCTSRTSVKSNFSPH